MKEKEIIPHHNFCLNCYQINQNDQINYLWPFARISCEASKKLELRPAGEMGQGVFAKEDIEKGEYLCCYFGKITHIAEEYSDYTFGIVLPNNCYAMTIDPKDYGNIARFFNHSYEANCSSATEYHRHNWQQSDQKPYTPSHYWQYIASKEDENRYYYYRDGHESVWDKPKSDLVRWPIPQEEEPHITLRANRDVKKDEQLFIDYGKNYWATRDKKPI